MHKLSIILFFLFPLTALAAPTYTLREVEFVYNTSKGEFTKDGEKRGAVVGFSFTVDAVDTINGAKTACSDGAYVSYQVPELKIPDSTDVLDAINKAVDKIGLLDKLDSCVSYAEKKRESEKFNEKDKLSLDGTVIQRPVKSGDKDAKTK